MNDFISGYYNEISIFLAGAVSTRKSFFTAFIRLFTFLFFLERLYNLTLALKTIDFRRFLKRLFINVVLGFFFISIIVYLTFFITGCSNYQGKTSLRQDLPIKKEINGSNLTISKINEIEKNLNNVNINNIINKKHDIKNFSLIKEAHVVDDNNSHAHTTIDKETSLSTSNIVDKLKDFSLNIEKKSTKYKHRKHILLKIAKLKNPKKSNFTKSLEVKACKSLLHALVEANKQFSNGCKLYYKNILHFAELKLNKKGFRNFATNNCEQLGTSLFFRWKVKIKKLGIRWPNIREWGTRSIALSPDGDIYRQVFITNSIQLHHYILDISHKYKECKKIELSLYNSSKFFGLLPKRNINEE